LAEQQTLNLRVLGSIPRRLTTIPNKFTDFGVSRSTVLPTVLPKCQNFAKAFSRRLTVSLAAENGVHLRGRLDLQRPEDVRIGVERQADLAVPERA
jgi:hypothetical protein